MPPCRIDGQGAVAGLLLTVLLQFLTAPVSAHLIGRAAHRRGEWFRDEVALDDLSEIDEL